MANDGAKCNSVCLPRAYDPAGARRRLEDWREALAASSDADGPRDCAIDACAAGPLAAMLGDSPYLHQIALREPAFLASILRDGPETAVSEVAAEVAATGRRALERIDPGAALRRAKRRLALAVAWADIADLWSLEQVTGALSDFACDAIDAAACFLLAEAVERGALKLPAPPAPRGDSGWIILGMGKLGGRELNYSSDIDLIVLYDSERLESRDPGELQRQMVRMTRSLMRMLSDRTAEGYVFRTDLRLRPDPASMPPAISVLAAEEYYESFGQNWERAALIKARPVAGDVEAGARFLQTLRPYIWRKHLDFAAIQDIHSIKRQINSHRGLGAIAAPGHNVKLGRGGIREIEFFVQTQQLIWGGRLPALRDRATLPALETLAQAGKIDAAAAVELADAYRLLRRVEHRLQMIDDQQTHTLPKEPGALAHLAAFLGYTDAAAFESAMLTTLRRVESHYAALFEDSPALSARVGAGGNLVFTGGESDPETIETLRALGFAKPQTIDAAVRGWHHGRFRAMRSTRARELLTELTPLLLSALAETPDPDAAFLAFDRFLNGLPAGVQLFSMFYVNPDLLKLVVRIFGFGAAVADDLARRPQVLEHVVAGADFFGLLPDVAGLQRELETTLAEARDWEEILDAGRRWAGERRFQVAVHWLLNLTPIETATAAWSAIAEAVVRAMLPRVETHFAAIHGRIEGGGLAVVALGKLGSHEMTARSDLDLIFVYPFPPEGAISDGAKPLPAGPYYARLSQRFINALSAPTAEGKLYEVDMRLRPSGNAGPIAVSCETFRRYQLEEAWTWEQMALTRARVLAGPPALVHKVEATIRDALTRPRDPERLVREVAEMRSLMARELGASSLWDVKHRRGGLIDIEFIAQHLQLRCGHARPDVLSTNTADALARLGEAGALPRDVAAELIQDLRLWQATQAQLRLAFTGPVGAEGVEDAPIALRLALSGVAGLSFEDLGAALERTSERAHERFQALIEAPAEALSAREPAHPPNNEKDPTP